MQAHKLRGRSELPAQALQPEKGKAFE